jgi:formylmethanofuran dehydrogenase subunit E
MTGICGHSLDEYLAMVERFHGNRAPGILIGGFMVDLATRNLPPGEFHDAICETAVCLPDAVQLLTPCTTGNGWLKVLEFGRFALTMYEKSGGEGVRVHLDAGKLERWPAIKAWFFKLTPKKEQDLQAILDQIGKAGHAILAMEKVRVDPKSLQRPKLGAIAVCPACGEAYPARDGDRCRACLGETPYLPA